MGAVGCEGHFLKVIFLGGVVMARDGRGTDRVEKVRGRVDVEQYDYDAYSEALMEVLGDVVDGYVFGELDVSVVEEKASEILSDLQSVRVPMRSDVSQYIEHLRKVQESVNAGIDRHVTYLETMVEEEGGEEKEKAKAKEEA